MRKFGAAVTIAAGLMLLAAPAYAQDYPPDNDEGLTLSESTVSPGESLTIAGDGANPGATVTIILTASSSSSSLGAGNRILAVSPALTRSLSQVKPVAQGSTALGSTTADGDGAFSVTVTIPSGLDPGTYTLTATSEGEVLGIATIRVAAAGGGALPFTGGNVAPGLAVGAALILAGGLLLVAIRRRRTGTV